MCDVIILPSWTHQPSLSCSLPIPVPEHHRFSHQFRTPLSHKITPPTNEIMQIASRFHKFTNALLALSARDMSTTTTTTITSSTKRAISSTSTRLQSSSSNGDGGDNNNEIQSLPPGYVPPKVWAANPDLGGEMGAMNRPTAGARFDKKLPVGKHDLQLYSLATPNGQKVTILLEELIEVGALDNYDAWLINIMQLDQFGSDFVNINPNSKIPALVDHSETTEEDGPLRIFESGSILVYLAEKYKHFYPQNLRKRTEAMNWLMWQMGSAPFLGGGFGHFYNYAPIKIQYAIDRYTMESKRQLDVLDKHLATRKFILGDEYSICDMTIWPWYGQLALDRSYKDSYEFLDIEASYPNVVRWAKEIDQRPAVKRGVKVNKTWGAPEDQLKERHDASDFETQTEAAKDEASKKQRVEK